MVAHGVYEKMNATFQKEGFRKAALVGVAGSLWFFLASLVGVTEAQGSLVDGTVLANVFWIVLLSSSLTYASLFFKKPEWLVAVVPALSWMGKEVLKQAVGLNFLYDFDLFAEALVLGVPAGFALYYFVFVKEWVRM